MSLSVCAGSARSQNILNKYGVGNRWPSFISLLLYPILTQPFRADWIPKLFRKLWHELVSTKFNLGKSHANSSTWRAKNAKIGVEIPNIWGDWSPEALAPSTNSSAVLAAPWMAGNLGRCSHQVSDWSRGDQTFHPLRLVGGHGWYITPFLKRSPLQTIPKKAHGDSQNCQVQIYTLLQPPSDPQPSHREDKGAVTTLNDIFLLGRNSSTLI